MGGEGGGTVVAGAGGEVELELRGIDVRCYWLEKLGAWMLDVI